MRRRSECVIWATTALLLGAGAAPASAAVTVGQLAPGAINSCGSTYEWLQHSVPGGNHYAMPLAGQITSWTHRASSTPGQQATLKIYRKTGDPARYQVVGRDGPEPVPVSATTTFPASIAVKVGDVLGLTGAGGANIGCAFLGEPGEYAYRESNLADGASGDFGLLGNSRLNVTAVLDPANAFTTGKVRRNRKKGTAAVTVTVPNPGELSVSGKGVRGGGAAAISQVVAAAGAVELKIRAKGKARRKLKQRGKVKIKPKITFTPRDGDPRIQALKVKLKKAL